MIGEIAEHVYVSPKVDFGRCLDISVYRENGDTVSVANVVEGGNLEFVPFPIGVIAPPTIRLTTRQARELLQQLIENGVQPPSAGAIEGELKATKYHLEDLRKMLKVNR
jgi:hypothetical protein